MPYAYKYVRIIYKNQISEGDLERVINEVKLARDFNHPNIIKIHEAFTDSSKVYIITENQNGWIELFDYIVE